MTRAIVLYPIIHRNLDEKVIINKLNETISLVKAINLNVVFKQYFFLKNPNPSTLLRKGKIENFKALLNEYILDDRDILLIFSIDISPIQQRNLEKIYGIKIIDKTSLILEIFGKRAVSREGIIQVELAHLSWQKSRLVRSWTHLERQRGGFGFLGGPGESQIELDKRMIDKRIKQLKSLIGKIKKTRKIQSINRTKRRIPIVSLLGYTNAGKSTLFNNLTKLNVSAKNKLFETLDTKISYFYLPYTKKAYLNDTVGFISDLPTLLIEAFKSTLDEVKNADLLIHVLDSSAENIEQQKRDVLKVLDQLEVFPNSYNGPPMIEVLNKIDKTNIKLNKSKIYLNNSIFLSAKTGYGVEKLKREIDKNLLRLKN